MDPRLARYRTTRGGGQAKVTHYYWQQCPHCRGSAAEAARVADAVTAGGKVRYQVKDVSQMPPRLQGKGVPYYELDLGGGRVVELSRDAGARKEQIEKLSAGLRGGFVGWLFGSSSAPKQDVAEALMQQDLNRKLISHNRNRKSIEDAERYYMAQRARERQMEEVERAQSAADVAAAAAPSRRKSPAAAAAPSRRESPAAAPMPKPMPAPMPMPSNDFASNLATLNASNGVSPDDFAAALMAPMRKQTAKKRKTTSTTTKKRKTTKRGKKRRSTTPKRRR